MDANKSAPHEAARAEPDRVSSRIVVGFGIFLVVLTVVAMALMAALFRGIDRERPEEGRGHGRGGRAPDAARAGSRRRRACSSTSRATGRSFRDAEVERLSTYGWMDRSTGAVHVPIERAMDLIAVRGVGPLPQAPIAMPALEATKEPSKGVTPVPQEKKK